jgi:hypothetical protein
MFSMKCAGRQICCSGHKNQNISGCRPACKNAGSFYHDTIRWYPGKSVIPPGVATNEIDKLDFMTDKITPVSTWLPGAYRKATMFRMEGASTPRDEIDYSLPAHMSLGAMQASILAETSGFGYNRREEVREIFYNADQIVVRKTSPNLYMRTDMKQHWMNLNK